MNQQIFKLNILPARQGDCLWLEYGPQDHPKQVLIDGGVPETYSVLADKLEKPDANSEFELLIVTHVDSDHIGGVLKLLDNKAGEVTFKDIWFNGWIQLTDSNLEPFGPVQGEKLTKYLLTPGVSWNQAEPFKGKAVRVLHDGSLPTIEVDGGLKLTICSPGIEQLVALKPYWKDECAKAGLEPQTPATSSHVTPPGFESLGPININQLAMTPFTADESIANGSSIAVLAEFEGKRLLLAADADANFLENSLRQLANQNGLVHLDAFKLPHHGSKNNISRQLLEMLDCPLYLFSTDGTQFKHPDIQAVARVIKFGGLKPRLAFNYRNDFTKLWTQPGVTSQIQYSTLYPPEGDDGLSIDLLA